MKKMFILLCITFIFSGCSPVSIAPSATPAASMSLTSVASPLPSIRSSAEASPSPSAAETEKISEDIINHQMQNFLNKAGDFSDEAIQQYLINYHADKNLGLGFVNESPGTIALQGWFFDYARVGDYVVMAVGFDGADDKNHIKPVSIPIKMYEQSDIKINFYFEKLGDWKVAGTSHDMIEITDAKSITDMLDLLKGHPLKLGFPNTDGEIDDNGKKFIIDLFGEDDLPFFENAQEKTIELATEVNLNESIITNVNKVTYSSNADFEIPDITTLEDLKKVDLSKVPFTDMIGSNLIP